MSIDFHTHIFPASFIVERIKYLKEDPAFHLLYGDPVSKMAEARELLSDMAQAGVDISVVFGFPWKKPDNFKRHNDYIIESVNKFPDRLVGFACFDPISPEAPKEAERCLKAGLKGVGELAVYDSDFTDNVIGALSDVMDICLEYNVPVLLHTNEPVGHIYSGKQPMTLSSLYGLIKRYPSNKIILAHWGGGLFFYILMKKEVRDVLGNVWFDTAASPYLYPPDIYRLAGEVAGFEKILFGSDYPLIKPGRYFKEMESSGISSEALIKIKGMNASKLLMLSGNP